MLYFRQIFRRNYNYFIHFVSQSIIIFHAKYFFDTHRRFKFIMLLKRRSGRWRIWLLLRRSFSTPTRSWKAPLSMVWIWLFDSQLENTKHTVEDKRYKSTHFTFYLLEPLKNLSFKSIKSCIPIYSLHY